MKYCLRYDYCSVLREYGMNEKAFLYSIRKVELCLVGEDLVMNVMTCNAFAIC